MLASRHAGSSETGRVAVIARHRFQYNRKRQSRAGFFSARAIRRQSPRSALGNQNVVFGECESAAKTKGIRWTRQSVRHYDGKVVPDQDPLGRSIFWFTVTPLEGAAKGTDRWAVEHNWVSITPLRLDLTDEADLARALALSNAPAMKMAKKRRRTNSRATKIKRR